MFASLAILAVTIHISTLSPTPKHPDYYGIGACSGVFISNNEVLTAAHCFGNSRNHQWVKTMEGISYEARVEALDKKNDLAVVYLPNLKSHPFVRLGHQVYRGDKVYTVNSGKDIALTYNEGIVNNLLIDDESQEQEIMHNAGIDFGASGSGLFDRRGRLVGINVAKQGGFSYAVDLPIIEDFLAKRVRMI